MKRLKRLWFAILILIACFTIIPFYTLYNATKALYRGELDDLEWLNL